jgi:hypothetical protein
LRSGTAKVCPKCGEVKPLSDFKDRSLTTGIGRFCRECKVGLTAHYYISPSTDRQQRNIYSLSKGDVNKLNSFSDTPEKYATGSSRARAKVQHLESIKHKFDGLQVAKYIAARKRYDAALVAEAEPEVIQDVDYSAILNEAFTNRRSVKIRYKGSWRTIDPYSLNNTYVVAYCHLARDIRTFRIDRIQGGELSEAFNLDGNLQRTSQKRLVEAPRYKGHNRRHRNY